MGSWTCLGLYLSSHSSFLWLVVSLLMDFWIGKFMSLIFRIEGKSRFTNGMSHSWSNTFSIRKNHRSTGVALLVLLIGSVRLFIWRHLISRWLDRGDNSFPWFIPSVSKWNFADESRRRKTLAATFARFAKVSRGGSYLILLRVKPARPAAPIDPPISARKSPSFINAF